MEYVYFLQETLYIFSGHNNSVEEEENTRNQKCGCKEETFRLAAGLVLVLLIAISWTGATQFGRSVFKANVNFDAPYFTAWLGVCFQCFIFPVSLLAFVGRKQKIIQYWK